MAITKEEVQHIATLCRIALKPQEVERLSGQLSHILDQFQALDGVDTKDVPPTSHSVDVNTVMRDDQVTPCLDKDLVLANAPQRQADYFKVNVVLEQ
jgi:aspartyl-tRNA(Asn)/glutamyl-tRNA(Gln) amidotransferase subunit C